MSAKRKRLVRIVCVSFVMLLLSMNVCAYETFGYHLTGSWYDGKYYVSSPSYTQNNVTVNYGNIADDAIEEWNDAINATSSHSLDIELSETTNSNDNDIVVKFIISNEGATGWRGFTYYYDEDDNAIRPGD
ncbi:MAG: hypothetical protein IKC03_05810, partial [Oscillospiraceae bacterium]|nr:hypothetical protein [Oscillospiraceae bacterium]